MKRKVKRYAGEDESFVEDDEISEIVKSRQKPDVEDMKRGIASGTPSNQPTARELQSSKAAEVRMPAKKQKPKARYSGVVKASDLGSQDFSSKSTPAKTSGDSGLSKASMAAGLGLAAAAGAGALGARRAMKEGTRRERIEPTMGARKSPVRSISAEEAAWEGEGGRAMKKGGKIKKMAGGGMTASKRADGIAQRGKTRGKVC